MRNRPLVAILTCLGLAAGAAAFGASPRGAARAERATAPGLFLVRGLDRDPVSLTVPGTEETWSAWSYRSGSEFDIAVSRADASGVWSSPEFLGRFDGDDQVQPAIAADASGHVYLAFAVEPDGEIRLAIRPSGSDAWLEPVVLSAGDERASRPELRIVGDRLVVAYLTVDGITIRDVALYSEAASSVRGVQDGPDGFPPAGSRPMPSTGGLR